VFRPVGPRGEDASYLLLGDGGHFTLRDWDALPDTALAGVDLLTLSACETAMGLFDLPADALDGAEMDGLETLALRKGTGAVLATLWRVFDPSTPVFMKEFYENRRNDGEQRDAVAPGLAQRSFIGDEVSPRGQHATRGQMVEDSGPAPSWTHLYFWATFVVLESWRVCVRP
jgi:CHAT domain-containing protein